MGFTGLEEATFNYNMHKSDENLKFQECWVHREFVDGEELRTVQITYEDSKINRAVRLWGSKRERWKSSCNDNGLFKYKNQRT